MNMVYPLYANPKALPKLYQAGNSLGSGSLIVLCLSSNAPFHAKFIKNLCSPFVADAFIVKLHSDTLLPEMPLK